jgi:hypothetical protein
MELIELGIIYSSHLYFTFAQSDRTPGLQVMFPCLAEYLAYPICFCDVQQTFENAVKHTLK